MRTTQKSKGIGVYAGATLGVLFPNLDEDSGIFTGSDTDINNGFGGSLFAGVKSNRYLATDLELTTFSGDIDSDLDFDDESLELFLSPGLGISNLRSRVEDEVRDFDRTTVIEDAPPFTGQ